MIVLHYRAIPDLREQVRRATNPAANPVVDLSSDLSNDLSTRPEPEPARVAEPEPLLLAEPVRTARRLGPEAPPRPCHGLNGSRRREDAPSVNRG